MNDLRRRLKRVLIISYVVVLHLALLYLIGDKLLYRNGLFSETDIGYVPVPVTETPIPTPLPLPTSFDNEMGAQENINANTNVPPSIENAPPELIIPVLGVKPDQLIDTFSDSRFGGRV